MSQPPPRSSAPHPDQIGHTESPALSSLSYRPRPASAREAKRAKTQPERDADAQPVAVARSLVKAELEVKRRKALERREHVADVRERLPSAESSTVPGLMYLSRFLLPSEERELLRHIDEAPWLNSLRRRVQHCGWRYNYKERSVSADDYIGPLPGWMANIVRRLVVCGVVSRETVLDQAIVNEYLPGQGIAPHVDQPCMFGDEVVMVSMGSPTTMDFDPTRSAGAAEPQHIRLEPSSVARVRGDARYKWKHGIAARRSDPTWPGKGAPRVPRQRRVSLTFRSIQK